MVTAKKPRISAETQRTLDAAIDAATFARAQRDRLRESLRRVLATIPNEFASAEVQAIRREARCAVEETKETELVK